MFGGKSEDPIRLKERTKPPLAPSLRSRSALHLVSSPHELPQHDPNTLKLLRCQEILDPLSFVLGSLGAVPAWFEGGGAGMSACQFGYVFF